MTGYNGGVDEGEAEGIHGPDGRFMMRPWFGRYLLRFARPERVVGGRIVWPWVRPAFWTFGIADSFPFHPSARGWRFEIGPVAVEIIKAARR